MEVKQIWLMILNALLVGTHHSVRFSTVWG